MRRHRPWIVAVLVVGLAFAQIATAAHACSIPAPASQPSMAGTADAAQPMPADCPEMAKQSGSTLNACLSHCNFGQQVDLYPDAPTAAIAPQPPLIVRPVERFVAPGSERASLPVALAAPPAQLLFSRFLI